jgi:ribosomal protein S18 acetylase RimI-like enzyme
MAPAPGNIAIDYQVFRAEDGDEMTRLLADAFTRREPLALAVGMKPEEFAQFVRALPPQAARERLTIVARLAESGEMVGAVLTNDPACEDAAIGTWGRKFQMVGSILGKLVTTYRAGREPEPGEMLHLYLLGVSERAAGMGVGQKLVAASVEHGAHRGYRVAIAEATNKTSQHIFRKLGFTERAQISYRDHLFEGEHVFASIAEHGGPILMEKVLQP